MQIRNPYAAPGEYRKAQLHCHTTASDGQFQPEDLLHMYKRAGYAFVCITDHNRVTRCETLNNGHFLAVQGCEDTVSRVLRPLGPHMGRLFVDAPLRAGSPQERIDQTRAVGGLVSLCHPSWTGNLGTGAWSPEVIRNLQGFHLVEIWNPHSRSVDDIRRWVAVLHTQSRERASWGVAVDDCHHHRQFNHGWIMVKVPEISAEAFRQALLGGAFFASTGPSATFAVDGARVEVTLSEPGHIRFLDRTSRIRAEGSGSTGRYGVQGDEGYVRVECMTPTGQVWSQPLWLETT